MDNVASFDMRADARKLCMRSFLLPSSDHKEKPHSELGAERHVEERTMVMQRAGRAATVVPA
jgi:hypothetical protein